MTTTSWQVAVHLETGEVFKRFGKSLHDAMLALGFTKAPGTFQTDWVNDPFPDTPTFALNTWAFSGPLQATSPLYIQIQLSSGFPRRLSFIVGTAYDVAGNMTSTLLSYVTYVPDNVIGFGEQLQLAAGDPVARWIWIALNLQAPNTPAFLFAFDPSRDATGAETPAGSLCFQSGIGSNLVDYYSYAETRSRANVSDYLKQNYAGGVNAGPWSAVIEVGDPFYNSRNYAMSPDGFSPVAFPLVGGCRGVPAWASTVLLIPAAGGDGRLGTQFTATVDATGSHTYRSFWLQQTGRLLPLDSSADPGLSLPAGDQHSYAPFLRWE